MNLAFCSMYVSACAKETQPERGLHSSVREVVGRKLGCTPVTFIGRCFGGKHLFRCGAQVLQQFRGRGILTGCEFRLVLYFCYCELIRYYAVSSTRQHRLNGKISSQVRGRFSHFYFPARTRNKITTIITGFEEVDRNNDVIFTEFRLPFPD